MGFMEAVKTCYQQKYITFSGRAPRSEYWYFQLFFFIVMTVLMTLMFALGGVDIEGMGLSSVGFVIMGVIALFYLASLLPLLSVTVRRLHDRNLSGWWLLASVAVSVIPFIGIFASLALVIILILKGTDGDNKFGPDPLRGTADASVFR